ncbi:MAG: hypothetical protein ACYC4E_00040 [Carboxydocellales bacterium]
MKKMSLVFALLLVLMLLSTACTEKKESETAKNNNTKSQTVQSENKPEDTTQYNTGIWDSTKMNGLKPPKADFTGEVQNTDVVKYLFMNIKKANAEKYVQYLKDSGYTTSPLEMSSTKYRAVKDGYEVIFSCSDFNSEGIGSGEIQMIKK